MITLAAKEGKTGVKKGAEQLEKLISRQIIFFLADKMDKKRQATVGWENVNYFAVNSWVDADIENMSRYPFLNFHKSYIIRMPLKSIFNFLIK
jgi:hypothetical protein